jgi:hypothetical protein
MEPERLNALPNGHGAPSSRSERGATLRLNLRITGTTYRRARHRVSLADLAAKARDAAQPLAVSRGSVRMRPSLSPGQSPWPLYLMPVGKALAMS